MGTIWFCLVAIMIAVYVLLDGFDLGAGAIHLLVAKTDLERRQVLASIGPVWDGNEVWLLAAGGTLYFAFPALYASAFSGFYLPLMMVLWLLILRGSSIEFLNHVKSAVWDPFWDFLFCASSLLLAVFFGAALAKCSARCPAGRQRLFSSHCGPISGWGKRRAFLIGTRFWWACWRFLRWSCTAHSGFNGKQVAPSVNVQKNFAATHGGALWRSPRSLRR